MQRIVHLISGGLDSVTLLYDLKQQGKDIHGLAFYYKQPHSIELTYARMRCQELGVPLIRHELPGLGGLTTADWVVPFRNAVMLSSAVNVAIHLQADTITIGCNADDSEMFPDCRSKFINTMQDLIYACGYKTAISAPYIGMAKAQVVQRARELNVPIEGTWSCYAGLLEPCGTCLACVTRIAALSKEEQ